MNKHIFNLSMVIAIVLTLFGARAQIVNASAPTRQIPRSIFLAMPTTHNSGLSNTPARCEGQNRYMPKLWGFELYIDSCNANYIKYGPASFDAVLMACRVPASLRQGLKRWASIAAWRIQNAIQNDTGLVITYIGFLNIIPNLTPLAFDVHPQ